MNHDKLFKQLLTTFFFEFVVLFLPDVAKFISRDQVEFLDKELFTDLTAGDSHEVDVVGKVRFRDSDAFFVVHVEDEAFGRPGFPRRIFHYFARLDEKYGLPVYPVALLSYATPRKPADEHYRVTFPNRTVVDFQYHAIQLNRMDWRSFAESDNPVAAALMTRMRIARADRPRVKLACVRMMLRITLNDAQRALIGEFVDSYLQLDEAERAGYEREADALPAAEKEKVMTVMNEWTRKGLEQGLEQGLVRQREMCLRQLRRRIGEVPPGLQERVRGLPVAQLEDLGEALLSMTTPVELEGWLASR